MLGQRLRRFVGSLLFLHLAAVSSEAAFQGFLKMTNGYFYDNVTGKPFIPHGVAYQTWNRPLGVWQTADQLRYDLDEMVKMGANSIRIDIVWQHAEEKGDNQWSWGNYDLLVQECEKRDIRIFALIGYQWPPNWFPDDWYTMHPPETDSEGIYHPTRWQSDIIGYETPAARAQYAEWISNVCARYKNSKAIAGWIVGNESGYLGLWSGLLDGYDPYCEAAFRTWLAQKYTNIANANAKWGTTFANFTDVNFVDQYRAYGVEGAIWADMVQWREDSIGSFTAVGAKAAKVADTNHLVSYSTVGMQWGEEDWRYHAEDRGKITASCIATGAPIDFFSVNNYPWSILGHESQNGQWGVSYTKKVAKVPVLYSETGFTSSETMWPGMNIHRQGPLIRNSLWESLHAGAIGTHVFSWMDRPYITDREKGFGIVYADRNIKPAYWVCRDTFSLMEQVQIHDLLMGSQDPTPDIAFLWTDAVDSQYNRYECEMQQIAGALERIGYEPTFITLQELADFCIEHPYTSSCGSPWAAVILPRNMRVEDMVPGTGKTVLQFLREDVVQAGVDVIATADLPGLQDMWGKQRPQYVDELKNLFGIDASDIGGFEMPMRRRDFISSHWKRIRLDFTSAMTNEWDWETRAPVLPGYTYNPAVWKFSDEIKVTNGGWVWAWMDSGRNKGFEYSTAGIAPWNYWVETNNVPSDLRVRANWGWQYGGTNMVQMYGDAGMWDDVQVVPFGRYTFNMFLRSNNDDPIRNGSYASVGIEWWGESNKYLGKTEAPQLQGATPGNGWVNYKVDDVAPSNTFVARRYVRVGHQNLLLNGELNVPICYTPQGCDFWNPGPTNWGAWNAYAHDDHRVTYLGTSGNAWRFLSGNNGWSASGGIYQDFTNGYSVGDTLEFGGYLYMESTNPLTGSRHGTITIEVYSNVNPYYAATVISTQTTAGIGPGDQADRWHLRSGRVTVPPGADRIRIIVGGGDAGMGSGNGMFFADDIFVRNVSRAGGSVYVDNAAQSPGIVVNDHQKYYTGRTAIFLYSMDNSPDGDGDGEMDTIPWKTRYDVLRGLLHDYFSVTPQIYVTGTNAPYCLPELRYTTNGGVLVQIKNYLYDQSQPNGGANQRFTLHCDAFRGKVIKAFEQGRILEENSDGVVEVELAPDGHEILYAFPGRPGSEKGDVGSSNGRMWKGDNARVGQFTGGPTSDVLQLIWQTTSFGGSPVIEGNRAYSLSGNSLRCFDARNGTLLWSYVNTNGGAGSFNPDSLAMGDGLVYATTKNLYGQQGSLIAVDAGKGTLRWFHAIPSSFNASPPVVESNRIYICSQDNYIRCLDARDGAAIWTQYGGAAGHYGGLALKNGVLYYGNNNDRYMYARNASDGSYKWSTYMGSPWIDSTPCVYDGKVFIIADYVGLLCYDANTGAGLWTNRSFRFDHRSPSAANGKVYAIGGPTNDIYNVRVIAMNVTNGAVVWQTPGNYNSSADVMISGDRLYVGGQYLNVLDANSGAQLWSGGGYYYGGWGDPFIKNGWVFSPGIGAFSDGRAWPSYGAPPPENGSSDGRVWKGDNRRSGHYASGPASYPLTPRWSLYGCSGAPVLDGNHLYYAYSSYVICADPAKGYTVWERAFPSGTYGTGYGLAVASNILYAAFESWYTNGGIVAFDAKSGADRWTYELGPTVVPSAPLVENNRLYFGASDGKLRAINGPDGSLVWEVNDGTIDRYNGAALADGLLFYGNPSNGTLYARRATDGSVAWTMPGGGQDMAVTPVVENGRLYVITGTNAIHCLNATNGAVVWSRTGLDIQYRTPAVGGGKVIITTKAQTGTWNLVWTQCGYSYYAGGYVCNTYTQTLNYMYVTHALDALTGATIWQHEYRNFYGSYGFNYTIARPVVTPAIQGKYVYAPVESLYVLDAVTGQEVAHYPAPTPLGSNIEVAPGNGWLFYSMANILLAASDGSLWQAPASTNQVVQITDAPAVVHPFGDKLYVVRVKYDAVDQELPRLKAAFMEDGDNGDGVSNEIYQIQTNLVMGSGEQWFWMWIPDAKQNDPDYKSTADGGKYVFRAWMEDETGRKLVEAQPRSTILEWGVRPTNTIPATVSMGQTVTLNTEWEDLYEQLWWQNTPMTRNEAYPSRVAVFRSTKTESRFPGQLSRVNEVCNWLESMGYQAANPLDIMFDNVSVAGLFSDNFNDGDYAGWNRIAGALNWTVQVSHARAEPGSYLGWNTYSSYALSSTNNALDYCITADSSRYVDRFEALMTRVGNAPTYGLYVYGDTNGLPVGNPLSYATFTAPSSSYTWTSINLPEFAFETGKKYHFVVRHVAGTNNSSHYIRLQYMGPYSTNSKGRVLTSSNRGASWSSSSYEPAFRIVYADGGSYAQPYSSVSTVTLLGNTRYGQKFTLPQAMTVTNIAAYIYRPSTNLGGLRLNLRRWSDKATLATTNVTTAQIGGSGYRWVNFRMPSNSLAAGTQYFYELVNLDPTGIQYAVRANAYGGVYGLATWGGTTDHNVYTTDASNWVNEVNYDLSFNVHGSGGRDMALRAWRIGNDENYIAAGNPAWSNVDVSADVKYCRQDYYFNDAELLLRYVDRNNYYKVGIRNFYGFWRLKFTVKVNGYSHQTGWLYEFPKTNRPAEGVWYNLRVNSQGSTNRVYFNGSEVGVFYATNHPTGRIALGTKAVQLGIWEPQKGYYFIDDDENGYSTDTFTNGRPLNLDYGYLNEFYRTLILPSTYVMSDIEAANVMTWAKIGLNSLIATDGGVGMVNETGAADLGRIEELFGVGPVVGSITNIIRTVIGTNDHYVTLDYTSGARIVSSGTGFPYTILYRGVPLGTVSNAAVGSGRPALIAHVITNNVDAPAKAFVFNYGVDTAGQLTNQMKKVALRAFEWARGQATKVRVELKYQVNPTNPAVDLTIYSTNVWILGGTGMTNINVQLPSDGLMSGDNLYWAMYAYPWDTTNAWVHHTGFFTTLNDGQMTSIPGQGLQLLGATDRAFGGRVWDMWAAYNTRQSSMVLTFGIKEKGALSVEDNFNDNDYAGWTPYGSTSITWRATNGSLQAINADTNVGHGYLYRNGLALNGRTNITVEFDVYNWATDAGFVYRGRVLYLNPNLCGWADNNPNYYTRNKPQQSRTHRVVIHVRDGVPYPRSDLYIDNKPVFLDEPIESTNWTTNTVGFLSASSNQYSWATGMYVMWDNFRIADESYWVQYTNVYGEYVPNNAAVPTFWPNVPDYDPAMLEYDGTSLGAKYQWYVYGRGAGLHSYADVNVYFSPRLRIELASFPKTLRRGTVTNVPVDWEYLIATQMPVRLVVQLYDQFEGRIFVETTNEITNVTGSLNVPVTIPTNIWGGTNFVWAAYMYPASLVGEPWAGRIGADDTYRWDNLGFGVEPETLITVTGAPSKTDGVYTLYSDAGVALGASIFTWKYQWASATFDGNYTGIAAPEGVRSFYAYGNYLYHGWGIFRQGMDLSRYSNGFLKFWVNSSTQLKVDLEGPQYTKRSRYIPSTTGVWQQVSLPVTNFSGVALTNMYGLFEVTAETPTTFYIDDVRWSPVP
jgi:outer membrane protein assembly factor BamB